MIQRCRDVMLYSMKGHLDSAYSGTIQFRPLPLKSDYHNGTSLQGIIGNRLTGAKLAEEAKMVCKRWQRCASLGHVTC